MRLPGETDLIRTILTWLQLTRPQGFYWRQNTGCFKGEYESKPRFVRFGVPGMADICGVLPGGRALYIEAKSAKGKQSPHQIAFQAAVEGAGGLYILARSLDDVAAPVTTAPWWVTGAAGVSRS